MNRRTGDSDRRRTITALLVSVVLHGGVVLWIALAGSHDGSRFLTPGVSSYERAPRSIAVGIVPGVERSPLPSAPPVPDGATAPPPAPEDAPPPPPAPEDTTVSRPAVPDREDDAPPANDPPFEDDASPSDAPLVEEDAGSSTAQPTEAIPRPGPAPDGTILPVHLDPDSGIGGTRSDETIVSGEGRADRPFPAEAGAVPWVPRVDATPLEPIDPVYPLSARRRGIEGEVLVEAVVSATGRVVDTSIIRSSRNRRLDEAAVTAVQEAPFSPARVGDSPRTGSARVRVVFALD
ncbi:MAG: energy transducer TonB [Alkalispirochaeta sp.]